MYFISYFYLAEFPIISERLSYLFIISYWFLIPVFYSYFSIQKRKIFFWALVLYGTMKTIAANDSLLCRYDNLLFGIEQYEDRRYLFNRYSDTHTDCHLSVLYRKNKATARKKRLALYTL